LVFDKRLFGCFKRLLDPVKCLSHPVKRLREVVKRLHGAVKCLSDLVKRRRGGVQRLDGSVNWVVRSRAALACCWPGWGWVLPTSRSAAPVRRATTP